MTDKQWDALRAITTGKQLQPLPTGFIIDSPWLPGWAGISMLDYYTSDELWFEANARAIREFPSCMFLPGFWSEYGMCTEPSAFGAHCVFHENEFPFANTIIGSSEEIDRLRAPNPRTDGLLPFMLKRLSHAQSHMEDLGHHIRFAVSRGPLNIASFLMGSTEFLMEMKLNPERARKLVGLVADFVHDWLEVQIEAFPSIDGILLLDDIVGFVGAEDFKEFAYPYLKRLFTSFDVSVRFFHNDAPCEASAPFLAEMGINLFNMGVQSTLGEIRELAGESVALIGNVPPRDVLASGSAEEVALAVSALSSPAAAACPRASQLPTSTRLSELLNGWVGKHHMRLDSHQHFWQYRPEEYRWITEKMTAIKHDYQPEDLAPLLKSIEFDGAIAVHARTTLEETEWLIALSQRHTIIKGVVGWVDLRSADVRSHLERLSAESIFKGVRYPAGNPNEDLRRGMSALQQCGLTHDILNVPADIRSTIDFVQSYPNQRFVLNHIAKPFIKDRVISPWREDITALAKCDNVWCKLSGMVSEAHWRKWTPEDFAPYLQVVYDAFGQDRLMIGSNWPVCLVSGNYKPVMEIVIEYAGQFSGAIQEKILGGNCAAFYGVQDSEI
jgi:uroporphyrinogen decarboxylase